MTPWTQLKAMLEYRVGEWIESASCADKDPDLFFPGKHDSAQPAKAVCAGCPVRQPCADFAAKSPVLLAGVWGGTTEAERRRTDTVTARKEGFRDRYEELQALGYNDLQIVDRLGMKPQSVLRQMQRHGLTAHIELVRDSYRHQQACL